MKKTKREMFAELLSIEAVSSNPEMVEFINHELELLSKKANSKTNKKSLANVGLKNEIIEVIRNSDSPMRVGEITNLLTEDYSSQKISALVKQLCDDGLLVREVEKKVAYFSVVA